MMAMTFLKNSSAFSCNLPVDSIIKGKNSRLLVLQRAVYLWVLRSYAVLAARPGMTAWLRVRDLSPGIGHVTWTSMTQKYK